MTNTTPLTGALLQQPLPDPLRVNAMFDKDKPCLEHHAPYTGSVPCTGVLRCSLCLTEWDPETGKLLRLAPSQPDTVLFGVGTYVQFSQGNKERTVLKGTISRPPWGTRARQVTIKTDETPTRTFIRLVSDLIVITRAVRTPDGTRPLFTIAADIAQHWPNVWYGAAPYLEAMRHLVYIDETYDKESADAIVRRFLFNAKAWRGEDARRIKAELRGMLK